MEFVVNDDKNLISIDRVCQMLSTTYWAAERSRECIETSIRNSICYGVYEGDYQVGFARVITDYATTFYVADVIIDEKYRGKGLGKKLLEYITSNKAFDSMYGVLVTRDAQGLYEKYGFIKNPEMLMCKQRKNNT